MPAGAVWAVVGATGTGKSALSLQLAESLAQRGQPAEVVNADAMQLYRGMDIGTAKLPPGERRGIPHHLLDELGVHCEASVAWYQPRARAAIDAIHARGHAAILVGGSGLYVSSVLFDFRFPPRDPEVRAELEAELAVVGTSALFARLAALDPAAAERVDRRNGRRVVRALELHALGASAPGTLPEAPVLWRRGTRILGMRVPRAELVARLDRRVEQMWERGLLAEVRGLLPLGLADGPTAGRAIGYAQAIAQLSGERSESEAIGDTQALTRRYARRQVGWFSRYPDIEWVDAAPSRFAAVLAELFRPAPRPD